MHPRTIADVVADAVARTGARRPRAVDLPAFAAAEPGLAAYLDQLPPERLLRRLARCAGRVAPTSLSRTAQMLAVAVDARELRRARVPWRSGVQTVVLVTCGPDLGGARLALRDRRRQTIGWFPVTEHRLGRRRAIAQPTLTTPAHRDPVPTKVADRVWATAALGGRLTLATLLGGEPGLRTVLDAACAPELRDVAASYGTRPQVRATLYQLRALAALQATVRAVDASDLVVTSRLPGLDGAEFEIQPDGRTVTRTGLPVPADPRWTTLLEHPGSCTARRVAIVWWAAGLGDDDPHGAARRLIALLGPNPCAALTPDAASELHSTAHDVAVVVRPGADGAVTVRLGDGAADPSVDVEMQGLAGQLHAAADAWRAAG